MHLCSKTGFGSQFVIKLNLSLYNIQKTNLECKTKQSYSFVSFYIPTFLSYLK